MGQLKILTAEFLCRTGWKILTRVGNTANREEVAATQWVDREGLPEFLAEVQASGGQLTPWFQLISQVGRECITRLRRKMENAKIYLLSFR
jgi:isopentenyldiphosphate isomerase